MANSKTFLLLGLLFAVLMISSRVTARELAESAQNHKTDEKEVKGDQHGYYGHDHGHYHGHYGHGHGGHWGHHGHEETESLDDQKHKHDHHGH